MFRVRHHPKRPFDMVFEPLSNLFTHLVDDMIDPDMYQTCIVDKKNFFVLKRTQYISCKTSFGKTDPTCASFCTGAK